MRPGEWRTAANAAGCPSTSPTKHFGAGVQTGTQIVMTAEEPPEGLVGRTYVKLNRWASLKQPPGQFARRHVVHPVRLQPLLHVEVAGHGHEPAAGGPHALRDRGAADLGDRAIDDGGELVDDREVGLLGERAGQVRPELFAVARGRGRASPRMAGRRGRRWRAGP